MISENEVHWSATAKHHHRQTRPSVALVIARVGQILRFRGPGVPVGRRDAEQVADEEVSAATIAVAAAAGTVAGAWEDDQLEVFSNGEHKREA